MKTKEEIEKLAENWFNDEILFKDRFYTNSKELRKGYENGYTQCQEDVDWELLVKLANKRYTEEDLRQAIEKAIYLKGGFDKEGFSFYKDDNEIKEEIINSLNKQD